MFLEVTGGPHQATVQSGFGVCGNRDQGAQEKVIRCFPDGPAGTGTPLLRRLQVGTVRSWRKSMTTSQGQVLPDGGVSEQRVGIEEGIIRDVTATQVEEPWGREWMGPT